MGAPPSRSTTGDAIDAERAAAFTWAASFRRRRDELRARLGDRTCSLEEVLDAADSTDDGLVRLLFVLESLPGAAKVATRRHLAAIAVDSDVTLRELTSSERALVLREFPVPGSPPAGSS